MPIFLDQLLAGGTPVNSLAVCTSQSTTGFSSKSGLAIKPSTDGRSLALMV